MSPSLNDDLLLETSDVSVKYCKDLKKSLWFGANDIVRELSGRRPPALELRESEMWALQHVNIRLRRGECLGVVGANGAGRLQHVEQLAHAGMGDEAHQNVHLIAGGQLAPQLI